ncbi:MAG: hypothetical protein AAGE52_08790 [Myxococcota bacterium]
MKRTVIGILALCGACGGEEGTREIQPFTYIQTPFQEIAAGARVAKGSQVLACVGSERTRAAPEAVLFRGGLNERATINATDVSIEATGATSEARGDDCVMLTVSDVGTVEVEFEGTISGSTTTATRSFEVVEASLEASWEDEGPALAGERLRAFVTSGGVPFSESLLNLPVNVLVSADRGRVELSWDAAAERVLPDLLAERTILPRAERTTVALSREGESTQLTMQAHVGDREIPIRSTKLEIQTSDRCSALAVAGPTDVEETSEHTEPVPLRARENAPEGTCKFSIEGTLYGEGYRLEVEVDLGEGTVLSQAPPPGEATEGGTNSTGDDPEPHSN